MKKKHYIVTMRNGKTVFVGAFDQEEAIILANAKMIKLGLTYGVLEVRETRYDDDYKLTDFNT